MPRYLSIRWLLRIAVVGGLTVCIVAFVLWRQDRGLDAAEQRLAAGDAAGALGAIDRLLSAHPDDNRAIALRGRALAALGRPDEAVRLFEQAGAAQVEDLRAWSKALLLLGRRQEALPILERLLQLEPDNAATLEMVAVCQHDLGRRQDALATIRRLSEIPGHEAIGHFQLASIYWEWGYPSIANEHFAAVLRFRPEATGLPVEAAEFFLAYGNSLLDAGNARKSLEVFERSGKLKPGLNVALRQGAAWQLIGDYEKAQESLERGLREDPKNRAARVRLAEVELQKGDPAAAIRWLAPLVDHDQATADAAYLLQRAYTSTEEDALAEKWRQKTVELRIAERRLAALRAAAQQNPQSPRAGLLAAYQAAIESDWQSAGRALAALLRQAPDSYNEPFVQQLIEAVQKRSTPPPIESFPAAL